MKFAVLFKLTLLALLLTNQCQAGYLRGGDESILWNDTIDPSKIGYIPNVQYIGQGYNVYYANPHSTRGLDPGFTNSPTIELDYQNNIWANVNPDRSYFIPDGVRATIEKSCIISFQSQDITNLSNYRNSLSSSVEFQAKYFGGKFSASADYQEVDEGLNSSNTQFLESKALCSVFQLDLLPSNGRQTPNLSVQLQQSLFSLRFNKTTESDYHDFFDRWGTHVITSVNLGSRFGYKYNLDKSEANRQRSIGINLEASASYFGSSVSGSSSTNQSQIDNFKKAMISWSSYSIGATPDADLDALKWAQQTLDTPMPIQISAVTFDQFFKAYSSTGVQGLTPSLVSQVVSNIDKHLRTYCSKRLLANGRISVCSDNDISDVSVLQYQQSSGKKFKVQNYKTKKFWETSNGNSKDGTSLQQWDFFQAEYQFFQVKRISSNTVVFIQRQTNKCIAYESEQENANVVIQTCNNSKNQQFNVIDIAPELFFLKSIINNLYVTIPNSNSGQILSMQKQQFCEGCQVFGLSNIQ